MGEVKLLKYNAWDFEGPYGDDILFTPDLAAHRAQILFDQWAKDSGFIKSEECEHKPIYGSDGIYCTYCSKKIKANYDGWETDKGDT